MFPEKLKEKIETYAQEIGIRHTSACAEELSSRYREGAKKFMETAGHRMAYLITRMPATYAAIFKVLEELIARAPFLQLASLLDLGAGPGTGMWAVNELFPHIQTVTLLERDAALLSLGKKLAEGKGTWIQKDLEKIDTLPRHDLVLMSYSLNEVVSQAKIVRMAWQAAKQILVLIEPGTVAGYERLMPIREMLSMEGAHLVAPCPHAGRCPLNAGDWCHFSERLPRTSLQRHMKRGTLGYEDEKFFYLIFSKSAQSQTFAERILRHPQKHSGFVQLTVCSSEGAHQKIISRKDKELYKQARKCSWGDTF